jgi:hypothetical protein
LGPFYDIFNTLLSEKDAVLAVVKDLLRPCRQLKADVIIEEVED